MTLKPTGTISPDQVRFSQASIRFRFRDGRTIDEMADGLRNGTIDPASIPPIRVLVKDGLYFTLDNRRLEAFRRAGVEVPYRMATSEEIGAERWKITTTNDGMSICVRGDDERSINPQ